VIGKEKIAALSKDISTAHLMNPFRQWIKTADEIKALMGESIFSKGC